MTEAMSSPPQDAHIAACGLLCTHCGAFKKGKCAGCQIAPRFRRCAVRLCCIGKGVTTCAGCDEFSAPRDYHECKKLNSLLAKFASFIFRTKRLEALALLRDQGQEAYLTAKRESGKM
ncbi:MAG: DUF3795 domain-containing protein [Planctomycetota bacterium]|jgi:hypothetical protein